MDPDEPATQDARVDEQLRALFRRPGMYVGGTDYARLVAFVDGMSLGLSVAGGSGVFGPADVRPSFYDWLCARVRVRSRPALAWWHLPLFQLPGLGRNEHGQPVLAPGRDAEAIEVLGALLSRYRREVVAAAGRPGGPPAG